MRELTLEALPRQDDLLDIIDGPADRLSVLYGGAMGGGKSYGIALVGLVLSLRWPGNRGFVGRLDFSDLRETTYQTCVELWDSLGLTRQHHKSEHWYEFTNGSRVLFGELKDPESRKSLNLGWYAIDEATEVSKRAKMMLDSRLRRVLPGIKYRALLCSNPEPGWVKTDYVDEPRRDGRYFIRSLPTDNEMLPEDYVDSLREIFDEMWIKRFLEGSWDAFEGAVYPEFDRAVHVAPVLDPPAAWARLRSIDHGLRNPTCCLWFAVEPIGKVLHVYDEHYAAGLPVSDHAGHILRRAPGRISTVIDPSTAATKDIKQGLPWSVQKEYGMHGIPTTNANNAVLAGIGRVKELLKARHLVIHENCVNLLRELSEYEWKEGTDSTDPDAPVKKDDHAVDALRYGCVALRPLPVAGKHAYSVTPTSPDKRHWSQRGTGVPVSFGSKR